MNVAFVYPEILPSTNARSIAFLNEFCAVSKILKSCFLYIPKESKSKKEIFKFYNIDDKKYNIKYIKKSFLGIYSNKIFNINLLKQTIKDNIDIFYVRHIKACGYILKNKQIRQKIIFESHQIFWIMFKKENLDKPTMYIDKKVKSIRKLETFIYNSCDAFTFISTSLKKEVEMVFNIKTNKKNTYKISTASRFSCSFIKKDFSSIEKLYYIGSIFYWKGVDTLIKAIEHIDNIKVEIITGGNEESRNSLISLGKKLSIEKKVSIEPYKKTKDIKDILINKAKVCVIPNNKSKYSNYSSPIKLFEYISTSCILIVADTPTIRDIIKDGKNGFLFKSGNVNSLSSVIKKVISKKPKELSMISKRAHSLSKKYTWDEVGKKIARSLEITHKS